MDPCLYGPVFIWAYIYMDPCLYGPIFIWTCVYMDLCSGFGATVLLYMGVSTVQEHFDPVCTLISGPFVSGHFPQTPPGADGSPRPAAHAPVPLDSPFLSASRFAVSIHHLSHTSGQSKERRGSWGCIVCPQLSTFGGTHNVSGP